MAKKTELSKLVVSQKVKSIPRHNSSWLGDVGEEMARKGKVVFGLAGNALVADAPKHVVEATIKALEEGYTNYAPNLGLYELREAIADKMKRVDHVNVDPETELIVTQGAQQAMFMAVMTLLNPGEEALMVRPDYPFNYHIHVAGGTAVQIPLDRERGFPLEAGAFEKRITSKTRVICLDNPHNPTGRVFTKDELEGIADLAKKHDLWVIFDSANEKLLWEGRKNINIASLPGMLERTIMSSCVSKSYGMGGYRVGYAAAPKDVIENMSKLQCVVNNVSPTTFAQKGAEALYRGPEVPSASTLKEVQKRRDLAVERFNDMDGTPCHTPEGGGVVLPYIAGLRMSSFELAQRILREGNVSTGAGSAYSGEGYLRVNFTHPRIEEALDRIESVIKKI